MSKAQSAKPSKYKAVKTEVDGITFASRKEAARYHVLKSLERCGDIFDLQLQPKFDICVTSPTKGLVKVASYRADFSYDTRQGQRVVEDVKSRATKTEAYSLRKRLVQAQYGITIHEI